MLFHTPLSITFVMLTTILAVSAFPFPRHDDGSGSALDIERRQLPGGPGMTVLVIEQGFKRYDLNQQGSAVYLKTAAYYLVQVGQELKVGRTWEQKVRLSDVENKADFVHKMGVVKLSKTDRERVESEIEALKPGSINDFKEGVMKIFMRAQPGVVLTVKHDWFTGAVAGGAGTSGASANTGNADAGPTHAPPPQPSGSGIKKSDIHLLIN